MLLAVQLLGPTGRPSRLQSFQTSPPPFGQPARDTTPVQIQQIRDLQNPPSLFVGLDSPEAHVFQYVVCQGPSIERHTQPIEYYPMEVKRNITLIMKRPIRCVPRPFHRAAYTTYRVLSDGSKEKYHLNYEKTNTHQKVPIFQKSGSGYLRPCPG